MFRLSANPACSLTLWQSPSVGIIIWGSDREGRISQSNKDAHGAVRVVITYCVLDLDLIAKL